MIQVQLKYLNWMTKCSVKHNSDTNDMIKAIKEFDRIQDKLEQKDINKYGNIDKLNEAINDYKRSVDPNSARSISDMREFVLSSGTEKIYEDEQAIAFAILTKEAAKSFGAGKKEKTHHGVYQPKMTAKICFMIIQ